MSWLKDIFARMQKAGAYLEALPEAEEEQMKTWARETRHSIESLIDLHRRLGSTDRVMAYLIMDGQLSMSDLDPWATYWRGLGATDDEARAYSRVCRGVREPGLRVAAVDLEVLFVVRRPGFGVEVSKCASRV